MKKKLKLIFGALLVGYFCFGNIIGNDSTTHGHLRFNKKQINFIQKNSLGNSFDLFFEIQNEQELDEDDSCTPKLVTLKNNFSNSFAFHIHSNKALSQDFFKFRGITKLYLRNQIFFI